MMLHWSEYSVTKRKCFVLGPRPLVLGLTSGGSQRTICGVWGLLLTKSSWVTSGTALGNMQCLGSNSVFPLIKHVLQAAALPLQYPKIILQYGLLYDKTLPSLYSRLGTKNIQPAGHIRPTKSCGLVLVHSCFWLTAYSLSVLFGPRMMS